ncbi:MAG: histidine kinase, partial [Bacteroidetes bacterium QH_10_64_37]
VTSYLQENDLYHGDRLPGDRYALATLGGGVIVIDAEGRVVRMLDGSSGLPDNVVNSVYTDREGQLWMALNSNGVFRAGLNVPLTVHDGRTGLEGTVRTVHEHRDTTYVATGSGLYVLEEREDQVLGERSAHLRKWGNVSLVWDMLSVGEELLVATQEGGVYRIDGRTKRRIADWEVTHDLLRLGDEKIVYAGSDSGLKGLTRTPDGWTSFPVEGGRRATTTTRYVQKDGLPDGYKGVETINGRVTVVSKKGLFQVENASGEASESWQFSRRSSLLPDVEGTGTLTVKAVEEVAKRLWVIFESRAFVGQSGDDGTYAWESVEPLHFPKSRKTSLYVSRDSTVWLGDGRQLFRYGWGERREIDPPEVDFTALVQQVTTLRRGEVVYGGSGSVMGGHSSLTLPYGRDIRIDVAAPLYGTVEPHEYRYKLRGRSDQWSDWTTDASQRYRNLWEGTYRFRVQARNDRGEISKAASLTITVPPPWYRSTWAYFFYGLAFIAVAFSYRRYRQIKEENRRVQERVRELERERVAAERIKTANERLREANRLKEDFLATTSHELRTPLTNILGALEVLRDMVGGEKTKFLDMIEQNGQRLKRTLNALLDLSMLRSGNEDVTLSPTSIDQCVEKVASDLREDAEEKGLSLRVDTPDTPVQADADEQYLEQILRNLVENAIKYTHEGYVAVSTGRSNEHVYLEVEDTGIGIDEAFLPDLFEEFKQESRGRSRTYEGNGLGLAISARLAEQMDGTIHVDTEKGTGSTFTVEFPRSSREGSEPAAPETAEA